VPQQAWSDKRERQYQHIRDGLEDHGRPTGVAEEIAARTVNKERARNGEARTASRTSTQDISSGRRGGLRSHRGPGGRTKAQLYEEARHKGVAGRSTMNKAQLQRAVDRHWRAIEPPGEGKPFSLDPGGSDMDERDEAAGQPTETDEERAADASYREETDEEREKVAAHEKEMNQLGANVQGEGKIE
jgi:hypothetical protein